MRESSTTISLSFPFLEGTEFLPPPPPTREVLKLPLVTEQALESLSPDFQKTLLLPAIVLTIDKQFPESG